MAEKTQYSIHNHNSNLFDGKLSKIKDHFESLLEASPTTPQKILLDNPQLNISGIYLFSEFANGQETFMYVGQALSLFARLQEHCAIRNHKKANFAYKLTIETTGIKPIPRSPSSTRNSMFDDPRFFAGFQDSVQRIKRMDYRFVEVEDKLERNLLEIYASVILESKFNNFS